MGVITHFSGQGTYREIAFPEGLMDGWRIWAILRTLEARGISIPESTYQRIKDCTDSETLGRWLNQAATMTGAEDLFAEEPEKAE
jgi:hypothetical protein